MSMTKTMGLDRERSTRRHLAWAATSALIMGSFLLANPALSDHRREKKNCSETAKLQHSACRSEIRADLLTSMAICSNVVNRGERHECFGEAHAAKNEGRELCRDQLIARRDLCSEIGQARYEPDMDPSLFQDPRDPTTLNSHYPLDVGNRWVFEEGDERIDIEVLDETKRVGEIDCIVVRDQVFDDGVPLEDTDDWFGIRTDGTIEYCGEEVKDFEVFPGDDPEEPELVAIDGSFKAGVDGAKSGSAFLGNPTVGASYRQEWDAGNAEDVGTVLSTSYGFGGGDPELDEFVPRALVELMCPAHDCVVIADRSTLEPGAFERKYYARGIGKFLEVKPEEGDFVPLVDCNFDPRCNALPVE